MVSISRDPGCRLLPTASAFQVCQSTCNRVGVISFFCRLCSLLGFIFIWRSNIKHIVSDIQLEVSPWINRLGASRSLNIIHRLRNLDLLRLRRLLRCWGFNRTALLGGGIPSSPSRWLGRTRVTVLVMAALASERAVAEEFLLRGRLRLSSTPYSWKGHAICRLRRLRRRLSGTGRLLTRYRGCVRDFTLGVSAGWPVATGSS